MRAIWRVDRRTTPRANRILLQGAHHRCDRRGPRRGPDDRAGMRAARRAARARRYPEAPASRHCDALRRQWEPPSSRWTSDIRLLSPRSHKICPLGRIHGLVNNAAIATNVGGKPFEHIISSSGIGHAGQCPRYVAGNESAGAVAWRGRQSRIVNIASDTALWAAPNLWPSRQQGRGHRDDTVACAELGSRGIGVTAVAPGIMRNEATEYVPPERHRLYETGRAVQGPQYPEDIVETIVSPHSRRDRPHRAGASRQCGLRLYVTVAADSLAARLRSPFRRGEVEDMRGRGLTIPRIAGTQLPNIDFTGAKSSTLRSSFADRPFWAGIGSTMRHSTKRSISPRRFSPTMDASATRGSD